MDFDTSNVIFILLFIFPGALVQILYNRFSPKANKIKKTSIVEFSEILVASTTIMAINLFIIYVKTKVAIISVGAFSTHLKSDEFVLKYILLTFMVTCIFAFLFHYFNKKIVTYAINIFNKSANKAHESSNTTIWEDIFEGFEFINLNEDTPVISIEKDGALLTRGFLRKWPAANTDCNELVTNYNTEINNYFKNDEHLSDNEKIFNKVVMEYCFIETGVVIKFYDMEKYNAHVSAIQNQINVP